MRLYHGQAEPVPAVQIAGRPPERKKAGTIGTGLSTLYPRSRDLQNSYFRPMRAYQTDCELERKAVGRSLKLL